MKRTILLLLFFMSIIVSSLFISKVHAWSTANGNSGWTCFPAGTKILMSDKSEKNIEDVQVGDSVMGYDISQKKMKASLVQELDAPIRDHLYKLTFSDRSTLRLTSEHPLYTNKGWKSIDPVKSLQDNPSLPVQKLQIGDGVLNSKGKYIQLVSMLYIPGNVQTYNLKKVSSYNNFFADSYLAHNKANTNDTTGQIDNQCPASGCGSQPDEGPVCAPLTCASYHRTTCGLLAQYFANGCGGYIYCPATVACPTPTVLATPTPIFTPTPTPTKTPTPTPIPTVTHCVTDAQCPSGYECYQPPIYPCKSGTLCRRNPAKYCRISACPLRARGDANCDQSVTEVDLQEFKKKLNNQPLCLGCEVDFNKDGKVNMIDYEIWRRTVYK